MTNPKPHLMPRVLDPVGAFLSPAHSHRHQERYQLHDHRIYAAGHTVNSSELQKDKELELLRVCDRINCRRVHFHFAKSRGEIHPA